MISVDLNAATSLTVKYRVRKPRNDRSLNPFDADYEQNLITVERYVIRPDSASNALFLIVSPTKIGELLISDILCEGRKEKVTSIEYVGAEAVSATEFEQMRKLHELLMTTALTYHRADPCPFDCGKFKDPLQWDSKSFKNYMVLVTKAENHESVTVKSILEESQRNASVSPTAGQLLHQHLHTAVNSPEKEPNRRRTYIVTNSVITLSKCSLSEYFSQVSLLVFRGESQSIQSAAEFEKWLKFNNGSEIRNALQQTCESLLEDEYFLDFLDHAVEPYFTALKRLKKSAKSLTNEPLLLAVPLPRVSDTPDFNCADTLNKHTISRHQTYERLLAAKVSPKELRLVPLSKCQPTPFPAAMTAALLTLPSHLLNFEKSVRFWEFQQLMSLDFIAFPDLFTALQSPNVNAQLNYENFETLGDSVLKFITSFHFFTSTNDSEKEMAFKKDLLIGNKNLRERAIESGLPFFAQTAALRSKHFVPSCLQLNDANSKNPFEERPDSLFLPSQQFGQKTCADFVESLIGAAFWSDFQLADSLKVIGLFNVISGFDFSGFEGAFRSRVAIPDLLFQQVIGMSAEVTLTATNTLLFNILRPLVNSYYKPFARLPESHMVGLSVYEQTALSFPDSDLIRQSVNLTSEQFQRLEFFGDSVLELYTIGNVFLIMAALGRPVTPEVLHNAKLAMLTTFQFSRFAVHFGLHLAISGATAQRALDIKAYVNSYDSGQPFMHNNVTRSNGPNKYVYSSPDLEDAFEAFVGAVFMAGGWPAIHQLLDPFMPAYFIFFAKYHDQMLFDLKSQIFNYFITRKIKVVTESLFEKGKHVVLVKAFPKGTETVIGRGEASDEASAAKLALFDAAKTLKRFSGE